MTKKKFLLFVQLITKVRQLAQLVDLSFCLGVQEKKLSEKLPIHPEILRKSAVEALEEVKSDNHKHTFVIENAEDLQDILNRIASGEFDE